jgi:hypothetical protein
MRNGDSTERLFVSSRKPIQIPDPSRQIRFHDLLVITRKTWLIDALSEALSMVDPNELKQQLITYVPADVQRLLAAAGIRDEHVFPTPIILEAQPTLVGYYRLLLGVPQKTFYATETGMSKFRRMEARGTVGMVQRAALPDYCTAMGTALADLVRQVSPAITTRDVAELPLLALGSQFQGGNNNMIGQAAIKGVFLSLAEIVGGLITDQSATELNIQTNSGRVFVLALANDPDVRLQERTSGVLKNLLSIEVKGGTDKSNVYNRGGEAEKSHQTARAAAYPECWTVINMKNIDVAKLKGGSPTTDAWFDTAQILARTGPDWENLQRRFRSLIGI